jgi:hypothetical protein
VYLKRQLILAGLYLCGCRSEHGKFDWLFQMQEKREAGPASLHCATPVSSLLRITPSSDHLVNTLNDKVYFYAKKHTIYSFLVMSHTNYRTCRTSGWRWAGGWEPELA